MILYKRPSPFVLPECWNIRKVCGRDVIWHVLEFTRVRHIVYILWRAIASLTTVVKVGVVKMRLAIRQLCPVMAHKPNSWSKHPGTRIEQVLAYCRDEQKYLGCIELLFCLTVTMTVGVRTWKFIGLMDEILPIYHPSFTENRSKIRGK